MSDTAQASGSQLTVIGTEHTLATVAVPGVFQLVVNLTPMAAGDVVELRAKQKVLSGDAAALGNYVGRFTDVQSTDEKVVTSQPISNALSVASAVEFSLKQTAGSVRTFDWRLDRVA